MRRSAGRERKTRVGTQIPEISRKTVCDRQMPQNGCVACCVKSKGSTCLLEKSAVTAVWLCFGFGGGGGGE